MAKDEEDTGPPPPKPVDFDVEKGNDLLEFVLNSKDLPSIAVLNHSAMAQLVVMAAEVQEDVDKQREEYEQAMADWMAKKLNEAKAEQKKAEEKADAA